MKSKTIFHAEGLCSPSWHFDCLHFSERPSWRIKLLQHSCNKVKVSEKEIIKVMEVKCQGHFAILLVIKLQFLLFMTYLPLTEVNGQRKASNY